LRITIASSVALVLMLSATPGFAQEDLVRARVANGPIRSALSAR
jgi:hypothetical protein